MPSASGEILYGQEWIDYDRDYLKVGIIEDGVFRITPQQIAAAGLELNSSNTEKWTLHHKGQAVPIEVTAEGIVFYGEKNRGDLDRHLFESPEDMQLNDRFSMHSDTASYYLSLAPVGGPFYLEAKVQGQLAPINEILRKTEVVFGDYMTKAYSRSSGASIYYSHYEPVEGFGSRSSSDLLSSNGNVESTTTLATPQANGNEARLTLRFGLAFGNHSQEIKVDNNLLTTWEAPNWTMHQPDFSVFPNGEEIEVSFSGTASNQDKANLAWMNIYYPANPVFEESLRDFQLPARAGNGRLELTGVGADAGAMRLYSPVSEEFFSGSVASGNVTFDLPASNDTLLYQLVSENDYLSPASATSHRFSTTLPTDSQTNYLILTSRRLNGPAIQQMADYRRSAAGGSYRVHVVNTEDLFDEFGYGVQNHPMAIRNYLAAARLSSPNLQYLFIIGKGREYPDIRRPDQLASEQATFFIPSFGFPASDNLLSAELGNVTPLLSTGRLAAISESEVAIYLEKLIEVEAQIALSDQTIEDREWMKQVMHLGGGGSAGEQFSIQRNLARLEATIESSEMGANVTSFFKTSSDPIESSQQDDIFNRINDGTAIITFYGHSSSQGFDFSIDDPDNYFNRGKYPYMLSLGCYSGDAFTKSRSISERFIFLPNKGAVAFAASKGVGFIGALGSFADELYRLTANEEYGNGIGDALRKNIESFSNTSARSIAILLEQFAISGDPAYRLHPHPGPDLIIDPTSVRFTPEVIPVQEANYEISLRMLNLGKRGNQDSVTLNFRQELPSGEVLELHQERVSVPDYENIVDIQLPSQGLPSVGLNRIFVTIDVNNEIIELPAPQAEQNNELKSGTRVGVPLTFIANTAKVAFPPPYAVIGGQIELISSTTNALAAEREYLIQVSDDRAFSNLLSSGRINSPGGVIRYQPGFTPIDSTTYYWRISPDSIYTEGAGYIWSESSFTWLAEQSAEEVGWAMQDPGQTIDGQFTNVFGDTLSEGWNFARTSADIRIFNAIYSGADMPRFMRGAQRLNSPFQWHIRSGISVLVIDSLNNSKWYPNLSTGLYNTIVRRSTTWNFNTSTAAGRNGLVQFLTEAIPSGRYVFLYSLQRRNLPNYFTDGWNTPEESTGKTIFDVLEEQGAQHIRRLNESGPVPYVMAFQQDLGLLEEEIATNITDTILMQTQIFSNWPEGSWSSEEVGPAKAWTNLSLNLAPENLSETDSILLYLWGISPDGTESRLVDQVIDHRTSRNFNLDISTYSPNDFPKMRAEVLFFDEEGRSAPTLRHLYLGHIPYGDVAINPQYVFSAPDSLEQGEPIIFNVGYENISLIGFDSLLIQLDVIDESNQLTSRQVLNPPSPPQSRGEVSFNIPTDENTSDLRLEVTLNPGEDQPEKILINNYLNTRVSFNKDVIDPILQVYFDGQRIREGDLVSSSPEILVDIRDDNRQLLLDDTAAYRLVLTDPNGAEERISFNDTRLEFVPATTAADNEAQIYFRPNLEIDGRYILEVIGRDRSNNATGRLAFRQEFEVINEQRVSNVLTYPNPFTTKTRFVYTLTGNEPPEVFRIQIMTVSGRVVRDVDLAQLESLKIGTHQTDFEWDGTDEYGDLLANGVYIYRVITDDGNGNTLKKHDTGVSQFFQRDLGKVVILR